MAINIGANDVANNMGPSCWRQCADHGGRYSSLPPSQESAGALLAGGDVVSTISKGIIDPASVQDSNVFIWAMMAGADLILRCGSIWRRGLARRFQRPIRSLAA